MAILEQLQAVVDFIVDGKIAASQPTFNRLKQPTRWTK